MAPAINVESDILIDGAWVSAVDTGNGVLAQGDISISRGRSDWASQIDPSRCSMSIANRDGRWSPDYTSGAHAGNYRRNLPIRVGRSSGGRFLEASGLDADVVSVPDVAGTGGGSPTAPAYSSVTQSSEISNTTLHGVDMPATLAATDRLLLFISAGHESLAPTDQGGGATDLDDWTLVDSGNLYTPWHAWALYEIELDATKASSLASDELQFSTSLAVQSVAQVIRTTGVRSGGEGFAWGFTADKTTSTNSAPNSPSHTTSWGADEHRWYTFAIYGSGGDVVNTYPTNYTSIADTDPYNTSLAIASAHRTTSAATEDPGAFALSGDENEQSLTFVYRAPEDASSNGALDMTGDIDVRAEFQSYQDFPEALVSGTLPVRLLHKSSGTNGWQVSLTKVSGKTGITWRWYDTGGTLHTVDTFDTTGDLPISSQHDRMAIRIEMDADNGASGHDVDFYYSDTIDGTWTQIGSTITNSGTTDIATNDAPIRIGGNPADAARLPWKGRLYAFQLRPGSGSSAVADVDFSSPALGASSFTGDDGYTYTVGAGGRITDINWRFFGELSSLPIRSDRHGDHIWTPIEAQGILRRIRQGNRRLDSALRRSVVQSTAGLIQYWPMEETGDLITAFGAAKGEAQMTVSSGVPTTAADATFLASASLPNLNTSQVTALVDTYTGTGQWQVRWLQNIPSGFTEATALTYITFETSDIQWNIQYQDPNGGNLRVNAARGGTSIYTSSWFAFESTAKPMRMTFSVIQNGSNVTIRLEGQSQTDPSAGGFTATDAVAGSAGVVTAININGGLNVGSWTFGHVTLQDRRTPSTELATELNAYTGERAGVRLERLCREEGIATRVEGDPYATEQMGAQRPGTLSDLLQECANTDLGILHEAHDSVAIAYRTRASMLQQTAAFDLDANNSELRDSIDLDRDDQGFANDVVVENRNGTTARAVLEDGSTLSVSEPPTGVGRYDTRFAVNGLNSRLQALATSRLALTSVDEPRVSRLAVELASATFAADPDLVRDILGHSLGDKVTVSNYRTEIAGGTTISQLIQGYSESLGNHTHRIDLLTSPSSPWDSGGSVVEPPEEQSVSFREGVDLATTGQPEHVLTALGYTGTSPIARSALDGILDDWVASTGGTTRNVTSAATWTTAMNNAEPGDLIRVTTGFDPGGNITARGDLYGISGANLTSTASGGDGGDPGLPIVLTCADGVYVDDNDTSSNTAVLDLANCRHVWAVGFNVRDGQFGIRCMNWGGSAGFPAYVAYCNIENIGDAGLAAQGWFQLITSSGGTPPAGTGNEWGFSEHFVFESNTVDGCGVRLDQFGEGIYAGRGSTPGWISYCKDVWIRGNVATDWTSDGIDLKPGCHRVKITDNEIHTGHAESGAPIGLCYVNAAIDDRPSWMDMDPLVYFEGNRVYDNNLTNTDASSVDIMGYIGLSGMRIANNIMWAHPQSGTFATWRARNEKGTSDATALTQFRNDPTLIVNNTLWSGEIFENGGYGASPTPFNPVDIDFDIRNNIATVDSFEVGDVIYFNQFDTTGASATVLGSEWELYNADPGNGGFGVRDDSQIEVVAEGTATSGSNVLRITAEDVGGEHYHGGLKLLHPRIYMQAELRVRVEDDADAVTSGVVIFWPKDNQALFPLADNPEGPWPAGGELDFWESFNNRTTRSPVQSFIHILNPSATTPYTSSDDQTVVTYSHYVTDGDSGSGDIDQSDWHKIVCTWTPAGIFVAIDNGADRTLTTNSDYIPTWEMELTLQLDAWSNTPPTTAVEMDVDYVLLREIVTASFAATASDFVATIPAVGVAGDAEWETYGNGSAFDLLSTSSLVNTGASISDLTFAIDADISGRSIPSSPNPGAFQPFE